jgi:hypothetical protein
MEGTTALPLPPRFIGCLKEAEEEGEMEAAGANLL